MPTPGCMYCAQTKKTECGPDEDDLCKPANQFDLVGCIHIAVLAEHDAQGKPTGRLQFELADKKTCCKPREGAETKASS